MKRVLLLLSLPLCIFASDDEKEEKARNKIVKLLNHGVDRTTLTEVALRNHNLNNDDFAVLLQEVPNAESIDVRHNDINAIGKVEKHYKCVSLDLSNNAFAGEFPLATLAGNFSKLSTLKINNNKITGFDFRGRANDVLKLLEARNTRCSEIDLKPCIKYFSLEELDLSGSKELQNVYMGAISGSYGSYVLKVVLKNTKANFLDQDEIRIHTGTAVCVLLLSAVAGAGVGWFLGQSESATTAGFGCGFALGFPLMQCLPNGGKRMLVQFVTK